MPEAQNLVGGYPVDAPGTAAQEKQLAALREKLVEMESRVRPTRPPQPSKTPEHLSVPAAINVITNDMRQLQEEIGELRSRLSPVLIDREHLNRPQESAPVLSKMGAELYDVLTMVHQSRELIELTMLQLDI